MAEEERGQCPDEGTCHHECGDAGCWRVTFCAPLSSYGDDWTDEDRAANPNPPLRIEAALIIEKPLGLPRGPILRRAGYEP